ncbi:MAG: hypothetical protein J4F49_05335 [Rhodobacteraceae bacterium]|nr:hypothetical protein [Paracoccaceae bacterium]
MSIDKPSLLQEIITLGSLAELRAVCKNPHLSRGFYSGLVRCWNDNNGAQNANLTAVSNDRFKHILLFLSRNPRVSTNLDPFRLDVRGGLDHLEFNTRCWKLATVVPVEPDWAYVLSKLYRNLHRYTDDFDDVEQVLDRWRPAEEDAGVFSDENPFCAVREQIAAKFLIPSIDMLNDDDIAVRQAFYRTFDPERSEFRHFDWAEWLERDDWCDIWLSSNENIWRSTIGRSKLRGLLGCKSTKNPDYFVINEFDEREEEYRKSNPEWFDNQEDNEEYKNSDAELDRIRELEQIVWNLANAIDKRRSVGAVWLLLAALVGSFFGTAIW